jgi:hypothetical protein
MKFDMGGPTGAHRQLLADLTAAGEDVALVTGSLAAARDLLGDGEGLFVEARDLGDLRELLRQVPRQDLDVLSALPRQLTRGDSRIGARFAAARLTKWNSRTDRDGACFDGILELVAAAPYDPLVEVRFQLGYETGVDGAARVTLRLHDAARRAPRDPGALAPAHVELLEELRRARSEGGAGLSVAFGAGFGTRDLALLLEATTPPCRAHLGELAELLGRVLSTCQVEEVLQVACDDAAIPGLAAAIDSVRLVTWRSGSHQSGPAMEGEFRCFPRHIGPATMVRVQLRRRSMADGRRVLELVILGIETGEVW